MTNPETGKRFRPTGSGLPTESAARQAREDAVSDLRNGRKKATIAKGATIAELFEWWLDIQEQHVPRWSSNSYTNWYRDAGLWTAEIGHVKVDELTLTQVNATIMKWGQPRNPADKPDGFRGRWVWQLSVQSLSQRRATLRSMINDAIAHELATRNAAAGELTSLGQSLGPAFPQNENEWTEEVEVTQFEAKWGPSETAVFLDSLEGHRWEALYSLYVYSAARRSEWLGARRTAIKHNGLHVVGTVRIVSIADRLKGHGRCPVCQEQHRGRVLIARTKNVLKKRGPDQERWIPLPAEGIGLLNRHLREQEEHRKEMGSKYVDHFLIFAEDDGSPIYPGAVNTEFEKLIKAASLPMCTLKDLRSNAASLFLAMGIDAEVVAKMTGHDVAVLREFYHRVHPELTAAKFQMANDWLTRLRKSSRPLQSVDLGHRVSISES